ncbi:MAG: hypothetical protein J7L86_03360 [Candidatus Marinimicrobia bacterium]|nr:hypothetical protein [Candidatus Neomarinimicrobiota bacterium]
MIIDPAKIKKGDLPEIPIEEVKQLILKTHEEIFSLRFQLKNKMHNLGPEIFSKFLRDAIILNADLLLSLTRISHTFINSVNILCRTFLEMNVDYLWAYSFYLKDKKNGETLAKRFYQIGRDNFLKMSSSFERISEKDPYLSHINIKLDIQRAESEDYIQLIDSSETNEGLLSIQKYDWRAAPTLITKAKDINFRSRAKIAAEVAEKICNLKAAPYIENWQLLNSFTHPSSMQYKEIEESISKKLYCRNLHIHLGFMHDMIQVLCDYMQILPNSGIREIRMRMNYMSL